MNARPVAANGIELSVLDEGEGPAVVLCHGFPELALSWRNQIPALVAAGYRVLAPDMRGFGRSSQPAAVDAYDIDTLGRDIVGLLDAVGEQRAAIVGHDWGATVAWHVALAHPDRTRAVVGMSIPPVRRADAPPISLMRQRFGEDFYMVWFQQAGPPEEALAANVARALTAEEEWDAAWAAREEPVRRPPWLSEQELDRWVAELRRTGFAGGLNYYRNIDRNWRLTERLEGTRIEAPALFLTGSQDMVRRFMPARNLERLLGDLRGSVVLEGAGHWVQQQRPAEVNEALLEFLAGLP